MAVSPSEERPKRRSGPLFGNPPRAGAPALPTGVVAGLLRRSPEGDELRERAAGLLAALAELEDQVRPGDAPLTGRLRISVPVLFGHICLGRIAARFADAHPGVLLEAVVEDRKADLLREGFDAALRINPSPDSGLSGRILGRNRLLLVASPALAHRVGFRGRPPEDIAWPAVTRQGWGDDGGWNVVAAGVALRVRATVRLDLSSPLAMRDAVIAGAGAALLPQMLVRDDLAEGRLVCLGERGGHPEEIWLVHASGRLPSRRLRALTEEMAAFFKEESLLGE